MSALTDKQILFVCGTQRSGTSAICELLTNHSDMIVCNERYFHLVNERRIHEVQPALFERNKLLNPIEDETQNYQWGNNGPYHRHMLAKYPSAKVIGDKVPAYHVHMKLLVERFPGAKFIFLTRNVYDVANSWQKRFLDEYDTVWTADYRTGIRFWNKDLDIMKQNLLDFSAQCIVVSYERLYSYCPSYLKRILTFLELSTDDNNIYNFYKNYTGEWMRRFSQRSVLSEEQRAWIGENANVAAQSELIDLGEVS